MPRNGASVRITPPGTDMCRSAAAFMGWWTFAVQSADKFPRNAYGGLHDAATASMIDAPLWSHELPYRGLIFSFSQIGFRSPYAGSA